MTLASDPIEQAPVGVARLWAEAKRELLVGDLGASRRFVEMALAEVSTSPGTPEIRELLSDRLECAMAALVLELEGNASCERLRAVLMRSPSATNQHLASYQLGRWFELHRQYKKGLFYARIAVEQGRQTGQQRLQAYALNLCGNLLAADSRFEEASECYRRALALNDDPEDVWVAQIRTNVGYCNVVNGQVSQGLSSIYSSLRQLRKRGALRHSIPSLVALSFALLEAGRPRPALRHATKAMIYAERFSDRRGLVNALYLRGDAATALGQVFEARRTYARLAELLERPELADVLLMTETRGLINVMA